MVNARWYTPRNTGPWPSAQQSAAITVSFSLSLILDTILGHFRRRLAFPHPETVYGTPDGQNKRVGRTTKTIDNKLVIYVYRWVP